MSALGIVADPWRFLRALPCPRVAAPSVAPRARRRRLGIVRACWGWLRRVGSVVEAKLDLDEVATLALAEALGGAAADAWLAGALDLMGTAS